MSRLLPYEEKTLLLKISEGDEDAFRTLYDIYFHRLSVYIFKLCKSDTATEEIVQDIFIKIWEYRSSLASVETPEAYIFSMARNKTIDFLRKLAKETGLICVLKAHLELSNNEIEDKLNFTDLRRLIDEALAPLSDQKKRIFHLSRNEGLEHDEIAQVMQLSKSTVKNHLSQTLQHLREFLSQKQNPEALLLLLSLGMLHS